MKKLKALLVTVAAVLCALSAAQDDMLVNLQLQINQATSPVVVADLATSIIITGRHNQTGLLMAKFEGGIVAPVVINTSAIMKPRLALREPSQKILLAGTMITGGQERVFAARIDHSQQTLDWLTILPGADFPIAMARTGPRLFVGSTTSNGTNLRDINAATGVLGPFRAANSTFPALSLISHDGDVYYAQTATNFLGPSVEVQRIGPDGNRVWFQSLLHPMAPVHIALSDGLVFLVGSERPDSQATLFRTVRLTQDSGGFFTDTDQRSVPFPVTRPVAITNDNAVLVHFSELLGANGGPRHQAVYDLATRAWTTQPLAGFGADVAVVEREKVPVFLTRETSGQLLSQIRATQHWAPVTHQVGHEPRSLAFDPEGRLTVASENIGNNSVRAARFTRKPIAQDDTFEMFSGSSLFRANVTGLLRNDLATFGAVITIVEPPTTGVVRLLGEGAFEYRPNQSSLLPDTFVYRLTNGVMTSTARVDILKQPTPIAIEFDGGLTVKGGSPMRGRVIFDAPRLRNDLLIDLDENTTATAIAVSRIAQRVGQSVSEDFTVLTAKVLSPIVATIRAFDAGFSNQFFFLTQTIIVLPPAITNLRALDPTIVGGAPGRFEITIDSAAPIAGLHISVTDNSTAIEVPPTVVVPAGQTSVVFNAPTAQVDSSRTAVVTATSNGISRSATVGIVGMAFAVAPLSVVGGETATGTLTLSSNVIGVPLLFSITDDSTATAPQFPTITIPAGQRVGSVAIFTVPVTSNRTSKITAFHQGVVRVQTMTVRAPALLSVAVNPSQVRGGQSSTGTVALNGRAPAGGIVVTLQAGAGIVQVPASVSVAQGQTAASFTANTSVVTQTFMVTIAARHNNITRTTTLILTP